MGNRYVLKQNNITPTAGNDIMTIVTAASRRARLVEVTVSGRGTSSAAQQIEFGRSTGGTTGGGALTPNKYDHQDQPVAVSTVNTTWTGQPTFDTHTEIAGWNALGGAFRWTPPVKGGSGAAGIEVRNADNISIRASAGVTFQPMSVSVVYEED
jgi:hypothetical protein